MLIKNEGSSENKFRMLGSITFDNNYVEITPVATKEQQTKKRSNQNGDQSGVFDAGQNTHLVEVKEYPEIHWTEPIATSKYL